MLVVVFVLTVEDVMLIALENLNTGLGITHRVVGAATAFAEGPEVEGEGEDGGESVG